MVQVKLYGGAKELAGRESVSLDCPPEGIALSELLRRIAPQASSLPTGIASAIMINGRNCVFLHGLETRIQDGDRIEILPIVTGG